jgi:hypothetical protein
VEQNYKRKPRTETKPKPKSTEDNKAILTTPARRETRPVKEETQKEMNRDKMQSKTRPQEKREVTLIV